MRNDSKFRAIPKLDECAILFKLEEKSLLNWLVELTQGESEEACSQTIYLLQTLNETSLSFKNRFTFLTMIREYLKQYINRLKGSYWDSGFPLSNKEHTYAEMVTWNYLLLGESFFIAADSANKKNDAIICLGMALQMLGLAQLHIAATYSAPNKGFWSLVYEIFAWAEKRKWQHEPIENQELKGMTVNTLFARCLIFHICDTTQFQPRDIRTIFKFLPKVCADLPITLYPQEWHRICILDLKSDSPPYNVKSQLEFGSHLVRYFSPALVEDSINHVISFRNVWSGTLKTINNALFTRVANTLGLQQKRHHLRKIERRNLLGVISFEDIISFLYKTAKTLPDYSQQLNVETNTTESQAEIHKTQAKAEETIETKKSMLSLSISDTDDIKTTKETKKIKETPEVSEAYFIQHKAPATNVQIWDQNEISSETPMKKVFLKEIKIWDSSNNGYSVSWGQTTSKAKIGDLFGIISEDKKRLEIAIIRRIALSSDYVIRRIALNQGENLSKDFGSDFRIGAEIIGFRSEIVYLSDAETPNRGAWGIFIPGISLSNQPDTVIYNIEHFKIGQNIYIYKGNQVIFCLLLKSLHSTTTISHVEVVFIETVN